METNVTCSAKSVFHGLAAVTALLLALSAGAQPATTRPARAVRSRQKAPQKPPPDPAAPANAEPAPDEKAARKWEVAGMSKREFKEQKRERQQTAMLERIKRRAEGGLPLRAAPTSKPSEVASNPYQLAEDFDRETKWDQKDNRAVHAGTDYGYSHENHLASAGCAPGEIGGTVSDHGISWFADDVSGQSRLLDVETPLTATGWCTFTATGGSASLGWFNSTTYAAPDAAPDAFLGWRQEGATLRAALGHTGTSFV